MFGGRPLPAKTKPPALISGSRRLFYFYPVVSLPLLCLDDSRRDEEDQLLIGGADRRVFEQVAQHRDISQQRHLRDVDRVLGDRKSTRLNSSH